MGWTCNTYNKDKHPLCNLRNVSCPLRQCPTSEGTRGGTTTPPTSHTKDFVLRGSREGTQNHLSDLYPKDPTKKRPQEISDTSTLIRHS